MDQLLFAAEIEFPNILVPKLPQNISNVNIGCAGILNNCVLYVTGGTLIYLHFIVLISIGFSLIMTDINYAIYVCSSLRATPGVTFYRYTIHYTAVITQDSLIDETFKRQIKKRILYMYTYLLCILSDYSYYPDFFNILSIGQKYLSFFTPSFLKIHWVINLEIFLGKHFFSWLCRFIYKLDKYFFIYLSWNTSSFESTYIKPISIKVAFCSNGILALNYRGCKGETIKLMPYYIMTDIS